MNICKQCGREFLYDDAGHGCALDLCSPFCDCAYSQREKLAALQAEVAVLKIELQSVLDERNSLAARHDDAL